MFQLKQEKIEAACSMHHLIICFFTITLESHGYSKHFFFIDEATLITSSPDELVHYEGKFSAVPSRINLSNNNVIN